MEYSMSKIIKYCLLWLISASMLHASNYGLPQKGTVYVFEKPTGNELQEQFPFLKKELKVDSYIKTSGVPELLILKDDFAKTHAFSLCAPLELKQLEKYLSDGVSYADLTKHLNISEFGEISEFFEVHWKLWLKSSKGGYIPVFLIAYFDASSFDFKTYKLKKYTLIKAVQKKVEGE